MTRKGPQLFFLFWDQTTRNKMSAEEVLSISWKKRMLGDCKAKRLVVTENIQRYLYAMRCKACSATALAFSISPRLTLKAMYWIHSMLLLGEPIKSLSKSSMLWGCDLSNRDNSASRMIASSSRFCLFNCRLLKLGPSSLPSAPMHDCSNAYNKKSCLP